MRTRQEKQARLARRAIAVAAMVITGSAAHVQRAHAQEGDPMPVPQDRAQGVDSSRAYGEPTSVYNAHRVTRVLGDGTHVVLADGTIWEVYLPDRPAVNTWRPGDILIVRESSVTQGDYDYQLKDGRTRGAVYARLVGEAPGRS